MPPKLIIWGASGHARVVADIIRVAGVYEIAGFVDDQHPERAGAAFEDSTILGGRESLAAQRERGIRHLIVAFGHCAGRREAALFAVSKGFTLATAIHPSAVIASNAHIFSGTVIAANAVVNPHTIIGANVIINTSASVDHDCTISDGVHIGPGVRVAGRVDIGAESWIGIGAAIADGCMIGRNSIIGAGAVVVDNIPEDVVAYGVPARVMRKNE